MGLANYFKKLFYANIQMKIMMLGLDAAGKTTVLYKLKLGEVVTTIPTIGMNVEQTKYKNVEFTVWDVGGRDKVRPLWRHYFQDLSALVFTVDSNDRERVAESADELGKLLREEAFDGVPVLVLANKQDLPNAMSVAELSDKLQLHSTLNGRAWHVQACCATSGDGLYEGLDWLQSALVHKVDRASVNEPAASTPAHGTKPSSVWRPVSAVVTALGAFNDKRIDHEISDKNTVENAIAHAS